MHATGWSRGLDVTGGGTGGGVARGPGPAAAAVGPDGPDVRAEARNEIASATREPATIGRRNDPTGETSSSGDRS